MAQGAKINTVKAILGDLGDLGVVKVVFHGSGGQNKHCAPPQNTNTRLPSILVPGLDLRVGERQRSGQVHSVLDAEIFLSFEASL